MQQLATCVLRRECTGSITNVMQKLRKPPSSSCFAQRQIPISEKRKIFQFSWGERARRGKNLPPLRSLYSWPAAAFSPRTYGRTVHTPSLSLSLTHKHKEKTSIPSTLAPDVLRSSKQSKIDSQPHSPWTDCRKREERWVMVGRDGPGGGEGGGRDAGHRCAGDAAVQAAAAIVREIPSKIDTMKEEEENIRDECNKNASLFSFDTLKDFLLKYVPGTQYSINKSPFSYVIAAFPSGRP